jgi:hypothetical protein
VDHRDPARCLTEALGRVEARRVRHPGNHRDTLHLGRHNPVEIAAAQLIGRSDSRHCCEPADPHPHRAVCNRVRSCP